MKFFKNSFVFFLVFSLLFVVNCGSGNRSEESENKANVTKTVKSSKSAIKVANEFVKAGMNGDFKKLAGLCCKDNGPYTTFENVRYLDLGNLGHIEKIVREEKSEVDPNNLKLVVARVKALGQIMFYCFYVFKTPAGYKVYLKRDYLWEYPPSKKFLLETAVGFYLTNKLNLKKATELAEDLVRLKPNDAQAHFHLASLYKLSNREKEMIFELKEVIIIAPNSIYADAMTEDYKIAICEELLIGEEAWDRKLKLKVLDYLMNQEGISERNKILLLEKALQDDSTVIKEKVARILAGLGNSKGKEVLITILSRRLRKKIEDWLESENKWVLDDFRPRELVKELGNFKDGRAAPVLIDVIMLGCGGFVSQDAGKSLLKIGKPAIPALEAALARENEYRKIWREKGWDKGKTNWRLESFAGSGIKNILKKLRNSE